MTVRFLRAWNGNAEGSIASFSATEENRLIGIGIATATLNADSSAPIFQSFSQFNAAGGCDSIYGPVWIDGLSCFSKNYGLEINSKITLDLPCILPSSGSVAANGALTLTTALPDTYPDCYMYFPADAVYSGSSAGMWYVRMTTTTTGNIYDHLHDGLSIPKRIETPTPIVAAGPGAYTSPSSTSVWQKVISIEFPKLIERSVFKMEPVVRFPATATRKKFSYGINDAVNATNQYDSNTNSTHVYHQMPSTLYFKNYNIQRMPTIGAFSASTSAALFESTENTENGFVFNVFAANRDSGADYVVVEALTVSIN